MYHYFFENIKVNQYDKLLHKSKLWQTHAYTRPSFLTLNKYNKHIFIHVCRLTLIS